MSKVKFKPLPESVFLELVDGEPRIFSSDVGGINERINGLRVFVGNDMVSIDFNFPHDNLPEFLEVDLSIDNEQSIDMTLENLPPFAVRVKGRATKESSGKDRIGYSYTYLLHPA